MTAVSAANISTRAGAVVEYFVRPRSVAIVGVSSKPGSAGLNALANFTMNDYAGDIHLVGRSGGEIDGRPVLQNVDDLPEGVDLAIFTLPAAGVQEAMEACVRRKVRAVTIFASGFAEVGEREKQDKLAAIAREGGVALLGPNCLGYTNYVEGVSAGFVSAVKIPRIEKGRDPAVAIISQSGGLMSHVRQGMEQRDLPVSYTISTGNEAGVGLADFVDFLADDPSTQVVVVYVEEVRDPPAFLAAARRARDAGKPVMMMHPGRSAAAREAVQSHTGALAGDHTLMRTLVSHAGILFVDTVDEMVDAAEILARFPKPPTAGLGIVTFSGAFCAIAHDFCEELGVDLPEMTPSIAAGLREHLPAFATPRNPLDLTTQPVWNHDLMRVGPKAILDDPALGSLTISIPVGPPKQAMSYLNALIKAMEGNTKPVVFSILGERSPLAPEFVELAREHRIIISRSAERSLRAMARVTAYGRALARADRAVKETPAISGLPAFTSGPQVEYVGKQALRALGLTTPAGDLAKSPDEAVKIANSIGYPVALKAQSAKLAHKTEAGGVLLNIADEAALRAAWDKLYANVARAAPGLTLDGGLVEVMSKRGLELIVGARRDPRWGPVVLVGLGGVLAEALGDVRVLPPDLTKADIIAELRLLKTAKLLDAFRGSPAVDIDAVAETVAAVGHLMRADERIVEVDVNPLVALPAGEGVIALDALIVLN